MSKNFLKISTLTILLGGVTLFSPPTVQAISIDGHEYQDINRMIESKDDMLAERSFVITALNPTNSTVRVLFQDEATSRWMMWPGAESTEKDVLRDLHLFWWENGPDFGGDFYDPADPRFHAIINHEATSDEVWLPANEEVELSVPESTFVGLKSYPAYYFIKSDLSTTLSGEQHFEGCLAAIGEENGYECRAHMNEWGEILYLKAEVLVAEESAEPGSTEPDTTESDFTESEPAESSTIKNGAAEPDAAVSDTIIFESSTTEFGATESDTANSRIADGSENTSVAVSSTIAVAVPNATRSEASTQGEAEISEAISPEISTSTIGVPEDTVEVPLAAERKEPIFPWWIVAFIFSGIFLLLWWLIPVGKRKKDKDR